MGGNDKQKLTRFIVNNFMPNLESPLVPLCRAPNLLEVHLPQFGNIATTYNVLFSVEGGGGLKRSRGLISDSYTQPKLKMVIHAPYY